MDSELWRSPATREKMKRAKLQLLNSYVDYGDSPLFRSTFADALVIGCHAFQCCAHLSVAVSLIIEMKGMGTCRAPRTPTLNSDRLDAFSYCSHAGPAEFLPLPTPLMC